MHINVDLLKDENMVWLVFIDFQANMFLRPKLAKKRILKGEIILKAKDLNKDKAL